MSNGVWQQETMYHHPLVVLHSCWCCDRLVCNIILSYLMASHQSLVIVVTMKIIDKYYHWISLHTHWSVMTPIYAPNWHQWYCALKWLLVSWHSFFIFCSPGSCPLSWVDMLVKCYKFSTTPAGWPQAEGICQDEGGHLAAIDTIQKSSFITGYIYLNKCE